MPDTKISALTDGTTAQSTDAIPVARSGANYYITPGYIGTTLLGSGTALTGSTVTTSSPVLNLTQTWNAGAVTFTGLKFNATDTASAAGSLLLDIGTGGGSYVSKFKVDKSGNAIIGTSNNTGVGLILGSDASPNQYIIGRGNNSLIIYPGTSASRFAFNSNGSFVGISSGLIGFCDSSDVNGSVADTILSRAAAATLQLGAADAAAPVAQTFKVQGVVAGTSNTAGANFTIQGSQGTGTGAGGSIIFQVAPAGSSGTAQNAYSTALTIDSTRLATFANGISTDTLAGPSGYVLANNSTVALFNSAVCVASAGAIRFSSTANVLNASDVFIVRDAANTLALRNGTSAQRFNVYNTYTSSTNYETFKIDWITTANTCLIGTEKGSGGGTARALALQTDGTTRLTIATDGTATFSGSIFGGSVAANTTSFPASDLNICSTTGSVFRLITASNTASVSSSVVFNRASGTVASPTVSSNNDLIGTINFQCFDGTTRRASASIFSYVDGTVTGSSSPGRIEFQTTPSGSTTSTTRAIINNAGLFILGATQANTVPALKPSSTTLQVRLGDDSAAATLEALSLKTGAPTGGTSGTWKLGSRVAATTTLDTTQYIEVDVGGTLYKLAVVTS